MTPAQSRALERQKQKMAANDEKIVAVRLNGKSRARLLWLARTYGSQQKALEALLSGD
jgi:hypothetical protein